MHEKTSWQEDTALERYQMITPLLDDDIDEAERLRRRKKISEDNGISERTLYRYEKSYRESGFTGLKPADRTKLRSKKLPENFDELLSEAIQLKREVPKRSVSMMIDILEMEKRVAPGVLKRSTLQDHLFAAGYGRKQMNQYVEARNSSSKRFCKPHRMMLVQGDIKYGIYLPIGRHGAKRRTYLSSAIDDHSRYILYSHYYDSQEGSVVEDTFRHVIQDYGAFDKAYFDNGHQYTARQLKFTLARLGIKVSWAPVRSGKSKGKIEKFHQVVDAFQREADLKKLKTLDELNRLWDIYLEDAYQNDAHDGIREYYESLNCPVPEEGITPQQEFNRDTRALTFLDVTTVAEAFLHHEERLVDKGACISFQGRKYETKPSLIGYKVGISYDPAAPEKITVTHPTTGAFTAEPLKIGSFCDKSPTLPVSMQEAKPETSRYLDALEKKHQENRQLKTDALSFAGYGKEADKDV